MNIKSQIENDLKQAMLAGEKNLVTTLRGLKSSILYAEVAKGARDLGLKDEEVVDILSKEAKKRQESAEMYIKGDRPDSADAEMIEKKVIEKYLPEKMTEPEVETLVLDVIAELGANDMTYMGKVVGLAKNRSKGACDGATLARIVKDQLAK